MSRIPRYTELRSKTPIKKRNPKRKAKRFERAYESVERVEWIKTLPCIVPGCTRGPIENAHVVNIEAGTGLKGKAEGNAPMCHFHHQHPVHGLHKLGPRTFAAIHGLDLSACAEATARAWRDRQGEAA